jgi:hypothetical protein
MRRRVREWAELGVAEEVHRLALQAYDRMIGLDLDDLAVDGCITKAPSGGEVAGRSPVDRGKQGLKRSILTEGGGIPLHVVPAGANCHDVRLLEATLQGLDTVAELTDAEPGPIHLDQGYAGAPTQALLNDRGVDAVVAQKGVPAPRQAGTRWTVERTHSWMNGYGKLRRCTEKRRVVVAFYLFLAAAIVVIRRLIQQARPRYRWSTRPTTRRLK